MCICLNIHPKGPCVLCIRHTFVSGKSRKRKWDYTCLFLLGDMFIFEMHSLQIKPFYDTHGGVLSKQGSNPMSVVPPQVG